MQQTQLVVRSNGSENIPYNDSRYPVFAGSGWLHEFVGMGVLDHWHWDLEFACIVQGSMAYTINQETVIVKAGQGIFINSGQIHRNHSLDGSDCLYRCELFHPLLFRTAFQQMDLLLQQLTSHPSFPYLILTPDVEWQAGLMKDCRALHDRILAGVEENLIAIHASAFSVVQSLLEHMPEAHASSGRAGSMTAVRGMIGYIQTHYREKITLSDISRAGTVGTSTCNMLFQRHFKRSPIQYLLHYRLEKAAELLKDGSIPVCAISDETGFSSPSYFAECFKARYGMTPSQYRQQQTQQR